MPSRAPDVSCCDVGPAPKLHAIWPALCGVAVVSGAYLDAHVLTCARVCIGVAVDYDLVGVGCVITCFVYLARALGLRHCTAAP